MFRSIVRMAAVVTLTLPVLIVSTLSAVALQPKRLQGRWLLPNKQGVWINITNVQGDWSWEDSSRGEALMANIAGSAGAGNIVVSYKEISCRYRIFILGKNSIDVSTRGSADKICLHGTFVRIPQ